MPNEFFCYRSSRISYIRHGTGGRLLLCFHGYGESASSFAFLAEAVANDFTVIAIDLPFHGSTEWNEGLYLDPPDLLSIIDAIVLPLPGLAEGWTLVGNSMGGRVALQLLELVPEKICRLVLISPDGLQMNPWYWLATQTKAGNQLFRRTMNQPGWLFFLLRAGYSLRLVNPSISRFASNYIDDEQARQDLYVRWTTMRGFRPRLKAVGEAIHIRHLPVRLLYGRYDRIIRWERGERFCRAHAPLCQLTLLPAGHQVLQRKYQEIIVKAL